MMPLIEVFILSRDRPEFLRKSLDSVLAQSYQSISVIVSDNSTNSRTEEMISNHSERTRFKYIRRVPQLASLEHLNTLVKESSADLVMLFHDDDVLESGALEQMARVFTTVPEIVAVACNSTIIDSDDQYKRLFNVDLKQDVTINNSVAMALRFIEKQTMSITPFSSYLYKSSYLKKLRFEEKEGHKHADVGFLIKLAGLGPIYWIAKPCMQYRIHSGNDSGSADINAIFSLVHFLKKNYPIDRKIIRRYIERAVASWGKHYLRRKAKPTTPNRKSVFLKTTAFYYFKYLFWKIFKRS